MRLVLSRLALAEIDEILGYLSEGKDAVTVLRVLHGARRQPRSKDKQR